MQLSRDDIKKMERVGEASKGEIYHVLTKGGFNLIVCKSMGGELKVLGSGAHRSYAINQAEAVDKSIKWDETLFKTEEKSMELKKQQRDQFGKPIYESTPQNHYDLASHHSKMAGKMKTRSHEIEQEREAFRPVLEAHYEKMHSPFQEMPDEYKHARQDLHQKSSDISSRLHDAKMRELFHSDVALKHYEMSGISPKQATDEHKKHMTLHHELDATNPAPFDHYALELAWNRSNPEQRRPKGLGFDWSK